ncbi:MAG: polysaccharide deacetylase family protein [Clostridia bacterium]|nr:polysaccharide deacetylase family protein [Clostridia bacterium]
MILMRYPEGREKALTFSYDDGILTDERLVNIFVSHGLAATFNLNAGLFAPEGSTPKSETARMTKSQALKVYSKPGIEVACHGYSHPFLEELDNVTCTREILDDRRELEASFGKIIRGMAYPFGTYNTNVVETLKKCGITYSRTTKATLGFGLPDEPLTLHPTCHHNEPKLFELADRFLNEKIKWKTTLFYVWGHSFEFPRDNNWDRIEKLCDMVSGKEDTIWYATNIEIIDYLNAYRSLIFSASGNTVENKSTTTVWIMKDYKLYKVIPGINELN